MTGKKFSPERSMEKICNAFLHVDEDDLNFLNSSVEKIRGNFIANLENNSGNVKFSNAQAKKIADALIDEMRKKISFDVKTESVTGDKAVVAVTVRGINFYRSLENVELQTDVTEFTDEEFSRLIADEIVSRIKNTSRQKPVTVKFTCEYSAENDFWVPEGNGENNLNPLMNAALT